MWFNIAPLLLLLLALALLRWLDPALLSTAWLLLRSSDTEALAHFLRSYGPWAVAVSLLLNTLINISGILPTVLVSGANAIVFGIPAGILVSWVAEIVGAAISFFLFRGLLRPTACRWIRRHRRLQLLDDYSQRRGFRAVLIARLLPLSPSGVITMLAAVSHMKPTDFLLATAIGKLPSIMLEVLIGYKLLTPGTGNALLYILLLLVAVSYAYLYWRKQRPPT